MSLTEHWPIVVGTLVTATAVGIGIHRLRSPDPDRLLRERMAADARDPYKRWVQAAFMMVTGECDYGYLPRAEARRMLETWWDVHGPGDHARVLAELASSGRPDNAWDLVRFILVTRMGVGAGWIDDEESWERIRPICIRLQQAYTSWRAMAQAYLQARRQWRELALDGSEDDDEMRRIRDNISRLDDTVWQNVEFRMPLGEP